MWKYIVCTVYGRTDGYVKKIQGQASRQPVVPSAKHRRHSSGRAEAEADSMLLKDILLYRQSNPMLTFSAFDSAPTIAEKDAVSRCHNFGSPAPYGLLQSNNVTTLCSTGSQRGVDVADIVSAVDRCCRNVERAERELLQPRPRLGGFVFHAGGLLLCLLPPSRFPSNIAQSSCRMTRVS